MPAALYRFREANRGFVSRRGTFHRPRRGRHTLVRRLGLLVFGSLAASLLALLLGPDAFWPPFVLPLVGGAVLLFEAGALLVTLWAAITLAIAPAVGPAMHPGATPRSASRSTCLPACWVAGSAVTGGFRTHARRLQPHRSPHRSVQLRHLRGPPAFRGAQDRALRRRADAGDGGPGSLQTLQRHLRPSGRQRPAAQPRRHAVELLRGADIVARYGGEEFAVLIRGDELNGLRLAERIRRSVLAIRVPVADGEAYVTVSCGWRATLRRPRRDAAGRSTRIQPCTRASRRAATASAVIRWGRWRAAPTDVGRGARPAPERGGLPLEVTSTSLLRSCRTWASFQPCRPRPSACGSRLWPCPLSLNTSPRLYRRRCGWCRPTRYWTTRGSTTTCVRSRCCRSPSP